MKVQTGLKAGSLLEDISARVQTASSQLSSFLAKANQEASQVTHRSAAVASTVSGCLASSLNKPMS